MQYVWSPLPEHSPLWQPAWPFLHCTLRKGVSFAVQQLVPSPAQSFAGWAILNCTLYNGYSATVWTRSCSTNPALSWLKPAGSRSALYFRCVFCQNPRDFSPINHSPVFPHCVCVFVCVCVCSWGISGPKEPNGSASIIMLVIHRSGFSWNTSVSPATMFVFCITCGAFHGLM